MVWTTIFVTSQPEPRTRWGRVVRRQVDVITCDGAPPGRGLSPLTFLAEEPQRAGCEPIRIHREDRRKVRSEVDWASRGHCHVEDLRVHGRLA